MQGESEALFTPMVSEFQRRDTFGKRLSSSCLDCLGAWWMIDYWTAGRPQCAGGLPYVDEGQGCGGPPGGSGFEG